MPRSKHTKKRTAVHVALAIVILCLALAVSVAVAGLLFYKQAQTVKNEEQQAVSALSGLNEDILKNADSRQATVSQAQQHTVEAKRISHNPLWTVASIMPYMGNDVTTVRGMTEVMDDLTGNTLPGFTSIAQQISTTQLNNANGQLNLQAIADMQDEFAKANQQLQQQREKYGNLPTPKIKIVASAYQQGRDKLDDLAQTVDGMNSAMQMVPELLGQNGARTYLLAIQTPSEQRSGGGLVGSLGTFHADQGTVTVGELHPDGTLLNGNNGNAEEKAVFNGPLAFSFDLRDTFAVPDIARNAEMLNATWQRSPYACNIDGLLAVDPVFIQEMVGISGDVRLENGTVLNGSNTAQYLLNTIYKSVPAEQQDAYFNYVAQTVLNNAFNSMSVEKLLNMGQIIGSMAQERHLYAYTFHEDEADHFQGAGTAKSAPGSADKPQVGIYLNEQNSSKLGWYIDRKAMVTATGRTKDGARTYHVRYTLTNTLTEAEQATCNWYILGGVQSGVDGQIVGGSGISVQRMLFYAPAGGTIGDITSTGDVKDQRTTTMDGQNVTTNVAYLEPGKSVTFEFDVTTSTKAKTDLTIDQSPSGKMTNDVDYHY